MFCALCRSEFVDGFTRCGRCDVSLIETLPPTPEFEYFHPITVFTTSNIHEAHLIKSLLEGSDMTVVMLDSQLPSLNPFLTNVLGGIKIAVAESDLEEAKEILSEYLSKEGFDPSSGTTSPFV